jgi:hypothetical protein
MYFLLGLMITSASCDLAISTNVLAAGWTISNVFKMVAILTLMVLVQKWPKKL